MKLSIITPTHSPKYLLPAYDSLESQPVDFEWVIVPNARPDCELPVIPRQITRDNRVRVIEYPQRVADPSVGALKRFACEQASGDAFVEFDHDDLLVPGILKQVVAKLQEGCGFVYSDAAGFQGDQWRPFVFDERWGWETYPITVYGREFLATRSFPVTPRSLCEVYFAPDHIRCWSRQAYNAAGGHDPNLVVGDDHDLICRTYLSGADFGYTNSCGYLYRYHDTNTVKTHNAKIQKQQAINRGKYLHRLIDEWLRRTSFLFLDLSKPGVLQQHGTTVRIDASDSTVGAVRAYGDVLPKLPREAQTQFMEEVYRVLVPGGYFCADFPSTDGHDAFAPHFNSLWNVGSFRYYTHSEFSRNLRPVPRCRFQLVQAVTYNRGDKSERRTYSYVDLCAIKGQRQPGRVLI